MNILELKRRDQAKRKERQKIDQFYALNYILKIKKCLKLDVSRSDLVRKYM
jgi:hypothetical protein